MTNTKNLLFSNTSMHKKILVYSIIIALYLALHLPGVNAGGAENENLQWHDAHYEARSFFFIKDYFAMSIKRLSNASFPDAILSKSTKPDADILRFTTHSDIFGKRSATTSYLDLNNAFIYSTFQCFSKYKYYSESHVDGDVFTRISRKPFKIEENYSDALKWSDLSRTNIKIRNDTHIYSNALTILQLISSGVVTKPGDSSEFFFAHQNAVEQINITAVEFSAIPVNYDKYMNGYRSINTHTVTALKIQLDINSKEGFELVGLQNDIAVYLDIKRRLILKIEGDRPWFGKTVFHLKDLKY